MVRMRDGVRLATDVYLPDGDCSPGPVLLTRLPYDKSGAFTPIALFAEYFIARGYRVVAQDVRGKFRSEGERQILVHEADDGYDTIDWISRQQWCNGDVAMWGNSYYGFTQLAAMTTQHPALKAIAPRLTGTQLGQPRLASSTDVTRRVEWAETYLYPLSFFHDNDNLFWSVDWQTRPYLASIEAFIAANGGSSRSFDQWYPRAHPLPVYRSVAHPFDARAIPTLYTIGWWDNCAPWSWHDVEAMSERAAWRDALHIVIEPIDHYSHELGDPNAVEYPTVDQWRARIPRILGPSADFFDVYLRGVKDIRLPRVRYTVARAGDQGRGDLRESDVWPPVGEEVRLVATQDSALVLERTGTVPSTSQESTRQWIHDPDDLVPTPAPNPFKSILDPGDTERASRHPGVLSFRSEPLLEDVEIVGKVQAGGCFRSTGPSMDVFVRLMDVDETGARFRIARGDIHIVDSTSETSVEITMDYAGYLVRAGHHLEVELASSDFPEFVPLPGTGADPWAAVETALNTQRVLVGGRRGFSVTMTTTQSIREGDST
ncbi:CocE/NonD family hydrolase [Arthrobacter sp. S2(2024)]|uniref:CocE/NonD family hydrolase n=1 Tax=Arthrobacter sp. S2(2024) TaxID=3111911 RepID=UPI002FCA4003